jgi:hypothetical protein
VADARGIAWQHSMLVRSPIELSLSMYRFMNRDWQWNNPSNPTDSARGPQVRINLKLHTLDGRLMIPDGQIYDNHLYD